VALFLCGLSCLHKANQDEGTAYTVESFHRSPNRNTHRCYGNYTLFVHTYSSVATIQKSNKLAERKMNMRERKEGEYNDEIFARMNVQQFREFVLYGQQDNHTDTKSYHVRLRENSDPIYNLIRSLNLETVENDKFMDALSQALASHCAVYMEIGMKAGARLVHQLLYSDDRSVEA